DAFAGGEPIPLLLADGGRPAGEVIESATALPALLVAVASPEDPAARALAIEVRSVMNSSGSAPGQARIDLAPGGLDAARTAAGGAEETVVVRAADGTSWGDAVAVAAVAVARGARQVIITTAALDWGGSGGARGHGASDQPPTVSLITDGQPTASGDLDRSVIRRVIRSRMGAFRACYERELVRRANLAGKVDLEFTIGADGAVSKAKGSGLPVVADCAARQVKTIKFPPPRGGGVVNVRYPLTFEPKDE
ncbi:MAG TPA: AgmX/PglI C-terminal domain-containing protein, partial [Kofleriaceae bacterium]|nr:AgmX/PglI C-terminal domain-containing protein [Kofleriaceae bacterium]